jgi:hypothetical protein
MQSKAVARMVAEIAMLVLEAVGTVEVAGTAVAVGMEVVGVAAGMEAGVEISG